jgi:hypothetical protein
MRGDLDRARQHAGDAADYFGRSGLHANLACWALTIAATCAHLTVDLDSAIACAWEGCRSSVASGW